MRKYNILITSVGSTPAINLIKLLSKSYHIIGTDTNSIGHTAGSLLVSHFEQVPYAVATQEYCETILAICNKYDVSLVIPINDIEIKVLVENGIDKQVRMLVPPKETISLCYDKLTSTLLAQQCGVMIGRIVTLSNNTDFESIISRERSSVGSKGIHIYNKKECPANLLCDSYWDKDYFLQEFVEGDEYTVDVACDADGVPFMILPRRRIEIKAGVATKVQVVKDEKLIAIIQKLYKQVKVPWLSNVQFIKRGDEYYFIELNYRYGGMSISTALCSYNYITDVIQSAITGNPLNKQLNECEVKWNAVVTRFYEEVIYEA